MHDWFILKDLLLLLAGAMVLGVVFEYLKQSAILGYLVAGLLLGPNAFDLIHDEKAVPILAELGVALLLFAIGLEFSMRKLIRLGRIGLLGGTLQLVLTTGAVACVCLLSGIDTTAAIVLGMMVSLSSTACVLRIFTDKGSIDAPHARGAMGILLLQDIAIVPLVLFVTTFKQGGGGGVIALKTLEAAVLILVLIVGFRLVSKYVLVRLLAARLVARNRELAILIATIMALGSAYAAHQFHISPAMGAFIAGIMLAESPFALQIRGDISAMRSLFVTLFFTAIGMLGDPIWIMNHPIDVLYVVVMVIVGKTMITSVVAWLCGYGKREGVAMGFSLAQVGEFSFVLATLAWTANGESNLISGHHFKLVVSATIVTLFVTPYLVWYAPRFGQLVERLLFGRYSDDEVHAVDGHDGLSGHVVIVGFGPSGKEAAAILHGRDVPVVIVDLQARNVLQAKHLGYRAQVGDASNPELLRHLNIQKARAAVVLLPDHHIAMTIIQAMRSEAPELLVLARARYHIYAGDIQRSGAMVVVDEEQTIGKKLGRQTARMIEEKAERAKA